MAQKGNGFITLSCEEVSRRGEGMTCQHYWIFPEGSNIGLCSRCGAKSKPHMTFKEITELGYKKPYRFRPTIEYIMVRKGR